MSLSNAISEAQELHAILSDVLQTINSINSALGVTSTTDPKVKEAGIEIYSLYLATRRLMGALRRMGLGEEFDRALSEMQKALMMIHTLQIALTALESSTSWGLILSAISFFSLGTQLYSNYMTDGYKGNLGG